MTEAEQVKYHQIITDSWRLFLKYRNPVDEPGYWKNLNEDARRIIEGHGAGRFVKEQIFSVLNEIDRIWKTGQERNNDDQI